MPVERFRDPEQARRALWLDADAADLARRIRALWRRTSRWVPFMIPRGLRKFGSIEEANAEREAWTKERVARLSATRKPRSGA